MVVFGRAAPGLYGWSRHSEPKGETSRGGRVLPRAQTQRSRGGGKKKEIQSTRGRRET